MNVVTVTTRWRFSDCCGPTFRGWGFTLIELVACLVILALVAGVTAVSLSGLRHAAQMRDVLLRIEHFDRLTRSHAAEHGQALELVIDRSRGTLQRRDPVSGELVMRPLQLPPPEAGYEILEVRAAGEQQPRRGELALPYSAEGLSPTYALLLRDPKGVERWLLVAGMTGQCTVHEDDVVVEQAMDNLRTSGDDAA